MKVIIALFTICYCGISLAQVRPLAIDTTGLHIPQTIVDLPDAGKRDGYILRQRQRLRNRMMADMSLLYAPMSFGTGLFLDPFHAKAKNYILHADMVPQFSIGGEWMPFPILLTPRYRVRIFGEDESAGDISLPVRTPSYMPGATVFIPFQNLLTQETKIVYFGSVTASHHSNGQDGDEFRAPGQFNTYNGNFSTNFIEPAIWYRKRNGGGIPVKPDYPGARFPYADWFGKLSYEINFLTARELRPSYGNGRINLNLGKIEVRHYSDNLKSTGAAFNKPYYAEKYRVLLNNTFVTGSRTLGLNRFKKRINTEGSFHLRIPGSPNTAGMFSAGYYGSDPYNIYYADSYFYARIGLSMGYLAVTRRERL